MSTGKTGGYSMKYNIKIYNQDMKEQARLENAYDITYTMKLNELCTCSFKLPKDDKKTAYCQPFYFVELFDSGKRVELFRILPQTVTTSNLSYVEYQCEHVLATLMDDVMFKYHQIGNNGVYTDRVIRYVLDHQEVKRWKLGDCDFKRQFEYKWENENLLASLFSIPKPFVEKYKWTYETTGYPWTISLKKIDTKPKSDIRYRKNLVGIEKTVDPTNIVTRLYALGFGEGDNQLDISKLNNGKCYIEKNVSKYGLKSSILTDRRFESAETLLAYAQSMLNELCEPYISYKVSTVDLSIVDKNKYAAFKVGDTVLIKDDDAEDDKLFPIVSISKRDVAGSPYDISLEIANKKQDISGSISDLMERARINDTYAQGATNLMQMAFVDNADRNYPAKFKFYIPTEMARINKLILNYTLEPFRAYSKATKGGGAKSDTTSSGGGDYTTTSTDGEIYTSTGSGGGDYTSTSEGGGVYDTTHGLDDVDGGMTTVAVWGFDNKTIGRTEPFWHTNKHEHKIEIGSHSHRVDIPDHTHTIDVRGHSHTVKIDPHVHSYTLPDHTHEILYGMYQGSSASSATLRIDGQYVNITDKEVNIIPYLSKDNGGRIQRGTWHTVEIVPDGLTRVNASLFIQLFTTSRGGGDY